MSNTIQTTPAPAAAFDEEELDAMPRSHPSDPFRRLLKGLASLRLTVVLFVLSLVLIFFGTLAQIDLGIWTVVEQYFRSFFVWIPFQLAVKFGQKFFGVSDHLVVAGSFPFLGGWLLGSLLLLNLLAAHIVRFKASWKRSGILMIHAGLILMMLGELVTGLYAVEGNMVIVKGQSSSYLIHGRHVELAVINRADPKIDDVVVVPAALLQSGSQITHDSLPFDLKVYTYMRNARLLSAPPEGVENPATAGLGLTRYAEERPEISGTDPEQKYDYPAAYITLYEKGTQNSLGTYLFSVKAAEEEQGYQRVSSANGTDYYAGLRFKRSYKPYTLHLINFKHDRYVGTDMAKDYRSIVQLVDESQKVNRKVEIYMNNPLRYRGETFYQSSFLPRDSGTILQVVHNPGWLLPYISCALVTLGMIVHFGMNLRKFLERRATL